MGRKGCSAGRGRGQGCRKYERGAQAAELVGVHVGVHTCVRAVQAIRDRWRKKGRFSEMLLMPVQQSIFNHSRRVKLSKLGPCNATLVL